MRRITVVVFLLAPTLAFAQQVNVGLDTSVTRFSDGNESALVAGGALTIVIAPTSEWTLAMSLAGFKDLDTDGRVRIRRPMLLARFLPPPTPTSFGVQLEAAPPVGEGAYVFDRLDPDVAVDGIVAIRATAEVELRLSVGYGYQFGNPDSQCFSSLRSVHTVRARIGVVVSDGPWSVQARVETRYFDALRDNSGGYGNLYAALRLSEEWSVNASAETGILYSDRSGTPTSVKVSAGIITHFGTVRTVPSETGVTTPTRLIVPIAHCS